MSDDITDTGPMVWIRTRTSRLEVAAHVTAITCVTLIVIMLTMWGGQ